MFKVKRNQIIIAALVVMIAVAGYLNYIESVGDQSDEMSFAETLDQRRSDHLLDSMGQEVAIITDSGIEGVSMTDITPQMIDGTATTAVFVNSSDDSSFFIQAKLDREQSRARERATLTELINNVNLDKYQRQATAESMLGIQSRIERESAAESLIEAKGFAEAYVRIDDNYVDVIVSKSELTEYEIAQIEDIVRRKTGFESSAIRIAPLKIAP